MNNSTIWWVILIVVILLGSYFLFINREPLEPITPDVSRIPEVTEPSLPVEDDETMESEDGTGIEESLPLEDETMTEEDGEKLPVE